MIDTKGIILAGGKGTRLYPLTAVISKQLQPIYDKPMIYYPLASLMQSGIKDVLIISTPEDTILYENLLGDGSRWGINLNYVIQPKPEGLPQAFILGDKFIGNSQVCLILGDNLFYGPMNFFNDGLEKNIGGTIFAYRVDQPENYGVVEFDKDGKVLSIEEKPKQPKSHFAIPGLYIFNNEVVEISKNLMPSQRGELEITDVHKKYLDRGALRVEMINRGVAWLDTGTPANLIDAGNFIRAIEVRQGRKIACLEEIALNQGFINDEEYLKSVSLLPECDYKKYCTVIFEEYKNDLL
jgi:glucose-1-phosphate thymidylyltransferase